MNQYSSKFSSVVTVPNSMCISVFITSSEELLVAFEIRKAKHENAIAHQLLVQMKNCMQNHKTIFCWNVKDFFFFFKHIKLSIFAPSYGTFTNATKTFAHVIALLSHSYIFVLHFASL